MLIEVGKVGFDGSGDSGEGFSGLRCCRIDRCRKSSHSQVDGSEKEFLLAGKVAIDSSLADSGKGRDFLDIGVCKANASKYGSRSFEDLAAALLLTSSIWWTPSAADGLTTVTSD
jgi:hypothetical protein